VCKLESMTEQVAAKQKAAVQLIEKPRKLKEMFMTCGIEKRDFELKMKKVVEFLVKGHPVKATVVPKTFLRNHQVDKDGKRKDRMKGEPAACQSITN
jgi:translation initiation factor IF-3